MPEEGWLPQLQLPKHGSNGCYVEGNIVPEGKEVGMLMGVKIEEVNIEYWEHDEPQIFDEEDFLISYGNS